MVSRIWPDSMMLPSRSQERSTSGCTKGYARDEKRMLKSVILLSSSFPLLFQEVECDRPSLCYCFCVYM